MAVFFMVALSCFAPVAFADTYTLSHEDFYAAVPAELAAVPQTNEFVNNFEKGGIRWNLRFGAGDGVFEDGIRASLSSVVPFTSVRSRMAKREICLCTLTSDGFVGKKISSVTFCAALYSSGVSEEEVETYTLQVGQFADSHKFTPPTNYLSNKITERTFAVSPASDGSFSLKFELPAGGDFAFSFLTIEYEGGEVVEPVNVNVEKTIPLGHPVILQASSDDATVFYTVDGSDNWVVYNPLKGVVFTEPGDYTLKYYAENAGDKSEVSTEEVKVVKASGLVAALQANNEIEVSGKVAGRSERYVLIAGDDDAALEDCLAVESADYAALQSARIGDLVRATGRATDKFGSEIKGLGSISSLSINGQASVPTNILELRAAKLRVSDTSYNINGRPADSHSRLVVTSSGTKIFR